MVVLSRSDRAVECKHCQQAPNITPPYISYMLPIQLRPTFCPKCHHHKSMRPYDNSDILCTDHVGISRRQAVNIVRAYNYRQELDGVGLGMPKTHCNDVFDYFNQTLGGNTIPDIRTSFTPLDIQCNSCGGSFTLLRNIPDVNHTPPLYCVWCSSNNVIVSQESTEEVWWTSLSRHYSLPINVLQVFYDRWYTHSHLSTFKEYMTSPTVKEVLGQS